MFLMPHPPFCFAQKIHCMETLTNSADPDEIQQTAVSNQGLHCWLQ